MGVKITNILLDKNKYLYWIDKNINITLFIKSDKNEFLSKNIVVFWKKIDWKVNELLETKYNIFSEILLIDDIKLEKWIKHKIEILIPIKLFNFYWKNLIIKNFIKIQLWKWFWFYKINKEINPNIILENNNVDNLIIDKYNNNIIEEDTKNNFESVDQNNLFIKKRKKKQLNENFINPKRFFSWFFLWKSLREEWVNDADYIHKDIFKKINNNSLIIKFIWFLINSKIYNFIYKYMMLLPVFYIIFIIIIALLHNVIPKHITNLFIVDNWWDRFFIILWITLLFIILSMMISFLYSYLLSRSTYKFKFQTKVDIEQNFSSKLKWWNILITDILKYFKLTDNIYNMDYNVELWLSLYVFRSFSSPWSELGRIKFNDRILYINLFSKEDKWLFNLNDIKLNKNNYEELESLLPNTFWMDLANIYYELNFTFTSNYLPDINIFKEINLIFNK